MPYDPELLKVPRECFINDVDKFEEKLRHIEMLQDTEKRDFQKYPGQPYDNILIVLDDIAGTKFARSRYLDSFIALSRHRKCTMVMSVQQFKAISPLARNNMSYYVLFETYNKNELRTIYDACGGPFSWEEFIAICDNVFETPHATLNINLQNPGVAFRYNNSFHSFILRDKDAEEHDE